MDETRTKHFPAMGRLIFYEKSDRWFRVLRNILTEGGAFDPRCLVRTRSMQSLSNLLATYPRSFILCELDREDLRNMATMIYRLRSGYTSMRFAALVPESPQWDSQTSEDFDFMMLEFGAVASIGNRRSLLKLLPGIYEHLAAISKESHDSLTEEIQERLPW